MIFDEAGPIPLILLPDNMQETDLNGEEGMQILLLPDNMQIKRGRLT